MRIRVTTRSDLFEERKRQHVERGYRIEDERPVPVNGMCSFTAVRDLPVEDARSGVVAQALHGDHGSCREQLPRLVRRPMSLKVRFRFDGKCIRHPRYNPKRDGRPPDGKCDGCESLYVIHLYTKIAQKKAQGSTGIVA